MLTIHPLAEIFPPMADDQFAALVADIRDNGLREPIILHDGQVLDGRNRYRACVEIGIEPMTRPWDGRGDPLDYVVSKNLHRRHLNPSQLSMVGDRIANLKLGANQHHGEGAQCCAPSQAQAADMLNIGRRSIQQARVVRANGVHALQQAVEAGDISVSAAAEIAQQPKEEQMTIMANGGPRAARRTKVTVTNSIRVPDGMTLEQVTRKGLALEVAEPDESIDRIADRIGISRQAYSTVRDILLLSDRDDLVKSDRAIVKEALADMRATNQTVRAEEMIKPVADKCWGKGRARRTDARIAKRIEMFERAVAVVIGACTGLRDVEIPHIPSERAKGRIKDLQEMKGLLTEVINQLKEASE
jgi:hypothetical protein